MHINKEYWYDEYYFSNIIWFIWWTRLILLTLYTLSGYFDMSERHIVSFCASHLKMLRQWVCIVMGPICRKRESEWKLFSFVQASMLHRYFFITNAELVSKIYNGVYQNFKQRMVLKFYKLGHPIKLIEYDAEVANKL